MGSSLQYIAGLSVKRVFVFTGICINHNMLWVLTPPARLPIKQVAGRKGDKDRGRNDYTRVPTRVN